MHIWCLVFMSGAPVLVAVIHDMPIDYMALKAKRLHFWVPCNCKTMRQLLAGYHPQVTAQTADQTYP